ncbi:MAG: molybdenum ABC transporter ATP-binding protein [Pseudomonadota bacterium]
MSADGLEVSARLELPGFTLEVTQRFSLAGCTAVFGPSGAGKSTLLRLIAGFARPDTGRIAFRGRLWCDGRRGAFVPPHERRVGLMFQDGRLFPHLSVAQNLSYADRRSGGDGDIRYGLDDIVDAFDLSPLLARRPNSLSGGERQRAALGRILLSRPDLLLLDEPLSALDRRRKAEILPYLYDLPGRFGMPAIYVSHNVEEILRLADETVILNAGRVAAHGPTVEVLNAHDALSDNESGGSIVEGVVDTHDPIHLLTRVRIGNAVISLPIDRGKSVGETVALRIDARNVALATSPPTGLSIRNVLAGTILELRDEAQSPFTDVLLRVEQTQLRAQVTKAAVEDLGLAPGRPVYALVKSASFDV